MTRPLNSDEQHGLFLLVAVNHSKDDIKKYLERRLTDEQRQQIDSLTDTAGEIFKQILYKQDKAQVQRFAAISKFKYFCVRLKKEAVPHATMTMISQESLQTLTEHALMECRFCDKTKAQANVCKIRIALDKEMLCETGVNTDCHYKPF